MEQIPFDDEKAFKSFKEMAEAFGQRGTGLGPKPEEPNLLEEKLKETFGKSLLTDAEELTPEKIGEAIENPIIKTVAFHKPGSIIDSVDGKQYIVAEDGSWRKIKG